MKQINNILTGREPNFLIDAIENICMSASTEVIFNSAQQEHSSFTRWNAVFPTNSVAEEAKKNIVELYTSR